MSSQPCKYRDTTRNPPIKSNNIQHQQSGILSCRCSSHDCPALSLRLCSNHIFRLGSRSIQATHAFCPIPQSPRYDRIHHHHNQRSPPPSSWRHSVRHLLCDRGSLSHLTGGDSVGGSKPGWHHEAIRRHRRHDCILPAGRHCRFQHLHRRTEPEVSLGLWHQHFHLLHLCIQLCILYPK